MTPTTANTKLDQFIDDCQHSGARAFEAFKALLQRLDTPAEREAARIFLGELQAYFAEQTEPETAARALHFSFNRLAVHASGEPERHLDLLQFPSAFSPEEWSFTFYEGLSRFPQAEFHDRQLVELGCGNGWITLALALRCQPQRIVGVDINPRAVVLANLNLYLNALDGTGQVLRDDENISLLDRVEFAESDLLSYFFHQQSPNKKAGIDRIIGCIPQVLNPDPEIVLGLSTESASDEELHALSNYCDKQGYVEDQFGLGLIARALEESASLLRANGKLILNLGGRPGAQVLQRMFERRGFAVRSIWQTKVSQAADTDIAALVNIERASSHRFEFYMAARSDSPICATTAQRYALAGGAIFHALTVFEAELPFPGPVKTLLPLLAGPAFAQARSGLDLSFCEPEPAEERLAFLADLAEQLAGPGADSRCFPYLETAGMASFRAAICQYLRSYFALGFEPEQVLVAPSREAFLRNLLTLYRPKNVLVEASLVHLLANSEGLGLPEVELTEAPRRVELAIRLMQALSPQLLITSLADFEVQTREPFSLLVQECGRLGVQLVVDLSETFELSSTPASNGVFQYLAERPLPAHVMLICDLVKNRVYPDLSVCFALIRDAAAQADLTAAAELTYSRSPMLNQCYYRRLLQDLLYFQRPLAASPPVQADTGASADGRFALPPAAQASRAFGHPAITSARLPLNAHTTRLDYGENCLPAPSSLRAALLESYLRQHLPAAKDELNAVLSQLLARRYGLRQRSEGQFIHGLGIAPLFAHLCQIAANQGATLMVAQGAYGHFLASATYHGVAVHTIKTGASRGFKLDAEGLAKACAELHSPWLYLNAPVVNPTGSCYSAEELHALFDVARAHNVTVLLDTVFDGLQFEQPASAEPTLALDRYTGTCADSATPLALVLLGGISKEFAGGGLRYGYAYSRNAALMAALKQQRPQEPHRTLLGSLRRVYDLWLAGDAQLHADLERQRQVLRQRAQELSELLNHCGWAPLPTSGGLFMVARPVAYEGRLLMIETADGPRALVLDSDNIEQALFYRENLLINNATWTGLPGYCRFVLSVSEAEFQTGCEKLRTFAHKVLA